MILILKAQTAEEERAALLRELERRGLGKSETALDGRKLLLLSGGSALDAEQLAAFPCVETVQQLSEPAPLASRLDAGRTHTVKVGDAVFGDGSCLLIAGPCAVESRTQLLTVARRLKEAGASALRGGAFKPRSSPYAFQGLGEEGMALLEEAKEETGLPVVTEITDPRQLPLFERVDLIQVGARNMQNYELLKELGRFGRPVLLKRSPAATLRELLLAAEYLMVGGLEDVILCERGIRSFDTATRYCLDLGAVPVLHEKSRLPVIVDPSHAAGAARFVAPMALAACAAGADGLMLEVHPAPEAALSDAPQALRPEEFAALAKRIRTVKTALEIEP